MHLHFILMPDWSKVGSIQLPFLGIFLSKPLIFQNWNEKICKNVADEAFGRKKIIVQTIMKKLCKLCKKNTHFQDFGLADFLPLNGIYHTGFSYQKKPFKRSGMFFSKI